MRNSDHHYSSYNESKVVHVKPKRPVMRLFSKIILRQRSEIGLVRDPANSTTLIRIVVGLLLLHLIIIGGIILHGKVDTATATTTATLVAPPKEPISIPMSEPTPVPGPVANPDTHITQTQPMVPADAAAAVPTEPTTPVADAEPVTDVAVATTTPEPTVATTPEPVAATPAVEPITPDNTPHKWVQITSGDTLSRIASRNNVTRDAILKINPEISNPNVLVAGNKIRIPLAADSQEAKDLAVAREEEKIAKEGLPYTIKRGDSLKGISRRFGTSVEEIQKLNNMGKSTMIRAGAVIKIPATEKAKNLLKK